MAALMESIPLATILSQADLLCVTNTQDDNEVLIASKRKTMDVFKISDQKPVKSWPIRHGVTVTSKVILDSGQDRFITVTNNQDVRLWNKDNTDFEKSKKKHSNQRIHEVLSVPDHDVIVLYENGGVGFLGDIKDNHDNRTLSPGTTIRWCTATVLQSTLCVIYVTQSKSAIQLHCERYMESSQTWTDSVCDVSTPDTDVTLCGCDSSSNNDSLKVYFLWSNGELSHVTVDERSERESTSRHCVPGVHGNSSMVTVDSSYIAVAGVTVDKVDGVCIFDTKFGIQQAWQPLPEQPKSKTKIYCVNHHLFVPCGRTLYAYRYLCPLSTVASLLDQTCKLQHTDTQTPHAHITWGAYKKGTGVVQTSDKVEDLFNTATNLARDQTKFKTAFKNLVVQLKKKQHSHWLLSSHMIKLLQRIMGEKKFWPKEEIRQLIELQSVPLSLIDDLLDCLIQHTEVETVYYMMVTLVNVPEKCLCKALSFYLQCEEEKIPSTICPDNVEVAMDTEQDDDDHNTPCPLSSQRACLVNHILTLPYSDVFLLEYLRTISFKHALTLLEYLSYLIKTCSPASPEENIVLGRPSLTQVVDWLCLLIDGHVTQFVLSPDSHVTLVNLHTIVNDQTEFFDGLVGLETLLLQLKAKSSIPHEKAVGQYCIEVLHVY